jgi:predicted nucleotidyltransferase
MVEMPFADDLRAFLKSLDAAQAEFIVVGGYAVAFHGFPRNTGDLDIWIRASVDNAPRVERAVRDFGFPIDASARAALLQPDAILRMGYPPIRIELLTQVSGLDFDACRSRAVMIALDDVKVPVLGLDDLIVNKRAAGRPKDLLDLIELERIRRGV